jgi:rhodanese-related sulfurtransferase
MTPEAATALVAEPIPEISREEVLRRLHDPALTIVDALPRESYETGHIPGALSLPVAEVESGARTLLPDPAAEITVYCAKFT